MHNGSVAVAGILLTLGALGGLGLASCTSIPSPAERNAVSNSKAMPQVIDPGDRRAFSALLDDVADKRVVFVGEMHDRYDHHMNQLAVIRGLRERGLDLAIGMEYFQEPVQPHLDDYIAGRLDEKAMLRKTRYYSRWRYDFRLYREILDYARAHAIPLVALNAPTELVDAVSHQGIAGLSPADRKRLPARIEPVDEPYRKRLQAAFRMHSDMPEDRFERFMEVQTVWDEYMAARAADYLGRNPDKTMVVLVGAAHVLHDAAIPKRLRRRLPGDQAVVVTKPFDPIPGVEPDHIIAARNLSLKPSGRLGVRLRTSDRVVLIDEIDSDSPAYRSGVRRGDRIVRIGREPIASADDVRLELQDRSPGDRLPLEIERISSGGTTERLTKKLRLL